MKPRILSTLLIPALLCSVVALADNDYLEARRLVESGSILPLEQVLQSVVKQRPGRILEVELESDDGHHVYEIELLDARGRVQEFKVDAHTGRLLTQQQGD